MTKQLTISDEAYELARDLAREQNGSVTQIVEMALRNLRASTSSLAYVFSDEERRRAYQELRELARKTAATKLLGATSDHSDMYDEWGLPK